MNNGVPAYTEGTTIYYCGFAECSEGDVITVNGTGGSSPRLWGFVDDEGNIIFQAKCTITPEDTADTLAEKIHLLEKEHFPKVIDNLLS